MPDSGERLIVKNFLGIREADLPLSDITLLIGPQASGKSVLAKVVYYFKSHVPIWPPSEQPLERRSGKWKDRFQLLFPAGALGQEDAEIRYVVDGDESHVCTSDGGRTCSADISSPPSVLALLATLLREGQPGGRLSDPEDEAGRFLRDLAARESAMRAVFDQVYIVAGRTLYAAIAADPFGVLSNAKHLDPFMAYFGSLYERVKRAPDSQRRLGPVFGPDEPPADSREAKLHELVRELLRGTYERANGVDYVVAADGRRTPMTVASSGQQELLPMLMILAHVALTPPLSGASRDPAINLDPGYGYTVYIEEPEAHLFPRSQRAMVELIATVYRNAIVPVHFVITTHSPYLLTAFNNLLQAGRLYATGNAKVKQQVAKVVPEWRALPPGSVGAFALEQGTLRPILEADTGLISGNLIDQVSEDLEIEFDKLLDAEFPPRAHS